MERKNAPVQVRSWMWKKPPHHGSTISYNRSGARIGVSSGLSILRLEHCRQGIGDSQMNRDSTRVVLLAVVLAAPFLLAQLNAQETGSVPETKAPAPTQTVPPLAPVATVSTATEYNPKLDWPWLARFRDANLALSPPAPGENRVVFMGDSITQAWHIEGPAGLFPGKPYINRGISGQTTPQMVLRFRQDVIALKPKVVVILAGINDIAGNTGPETLEQIEDNYTSMAELASANHIHVVFCSVLPAYEIHWRLGINPAEPVLALNRWLKAYAAKNGHVYVDFHTAMKDERNGLPPSLSPDGVHPLPAGYAIMVPLVEAGIEKALALR
jgi:lysophospholipase L1-like esterase